MNDAANVTMELQFTTAGNVSRSATTVICYTEENHTASGSSDGISIYPDVESDKDKVSTELSSSLDPANRSNMALTTYTPAAAEKNRRRRKKSPIEKSVRPEDEPKAFQLCTQLYKFAQHLAEYNRLYQRSFPQLMSTKNKYYISTEQNGVGSLDLLFIAFCQFMGMEKIKNLTTDSGERVFCWLGKRKASEILPVLRPNHHIVNRLPLDIYLKDKQSLAFSLKANMFQKGISYPAHKCPQLQGAQIAYQLLCPHQYAEHSFLRCQEPGCLQQLEQEARTERGIDRLHDGDFCPCFVANYFVPETWVFASSVQQSVFINDIARLAPESQWIVKPSYLRSGRGVRVLPSVEQLRAFLKVQTCHRFMWGQNYVVQRYIKNPMLTDAGKKFDVRMFLLVVVGKFWRVLGFLHPGYVRKVANPYRKMSKGDKFDTSQHLANTRVWVQATAKTAAQTPVPSPPPNPTSWVKRGADNQAPEEKKGDQPQKKRQQKQRQNSAMSGGKGKRERLQSDTSRLEPYEPVPLTGFYRNSFETDECEEFNYAVRHGCLKYNKRNLPLLLGANQRIPGATHLRTAATDTAATSATESAVTMTTFSKSTKVTKMGGGSKRTESTYTPCPLRDSKLLEQFATNKEFIRCLQTMVSRICMSIFDQVKEQSNCHQQFSLDICIDENGKPWLLEVNPSIITEDVNWSSRTIRQVIPAVFIEGLSLANECIRKSLNFLALRTPKTHLRKPQDLVFRQNFLWMYSTPASRCEMFELKSLKYSVDSMFKAQLASRGIVYRPIDYYPKKNKKSISRAVRIQQESCITTNESNSNRRCGYRFPTPVISVPVLEEDIAYSTRYTRIQPDAIGRQRCVRQLERETKSRATSNKLARFTAYRNSRLRSMYVKQRVQLD